MVRLSCLITELSRLVGPSTLNTGSGISRSITFLTSNRYGTLPCAANAAKIGYAMYATRPFCTAALHLLTRSGGVWKWDEKCFHDRSKYGSTTFAKLTAPFAGVTRTPF